VSDIDAVLERLVADESFRSMLHTDPHGALAAYDLTTDDLRLLVARLSREADGARRGRRGTTPSALFTLLVRGADEVDREKRDDRIQ
jgi:hypothetical protein